MGGKEINFEDKKCHQKQFLQKQKVIQGRRHSY